MGRTQFAAPIEMYIDPETDYEVWRLTNGTVQERAFYYTNPGYSPNGRHIVFSARDVERAQRIHVMDADGSNVRGFGDWYSVGGDIWDLWTDQAEGAWSKDSRYYYACGDLMYVEVATNKVLQLSSSAAPFYWPFLSPDGQTLCGVSILYDSDSGGTIKFINTDGSGYRQFDMPYNRGGKLDVTRGWIGNEYIWYDTYPESGIRPRMRPVMSTSDGRLSGFLDVINPTDEWEGTFGHTTLSPDGIAVGNGAGLVSGHGRTFEFANTQFWTPDRAEREIRPIVDKGTYPDFGVPLGTHSNFSPDGKWLVLEHVNSDLGKMAAYPVDGKSSPVWLVRFRQREKYVGGNVGFRPYQWPTWSPDGTKILFWSDSMQEEGNEDLYLVVFKRPDAPTELSASRVGSQVAVTWKPAFQHREIKEYEVFRAALEGGAYEKIGTVSEHYTYLEAPSKVTADAGVLWVDTTVGFPEQGVIQVMGLSTERPQELVAYTGKTSDSFTGCTRGVLGTEAAEHWNDAFVWRYTGTHAYLDAIDLGGWYKVRSVEWSGLVSELSEPVFVPAHNAGMPSAPLSSVGTVCPRRELSSLHRSL